MAEPTSPPVLESRGKDTEVYRPLSGLAVAALGLAIFYTLVLVVVGISSLVSRTPMFMSAWTFLMPAGACGLALAARQHLRYAEGTRSGAALASWALRLSTLGLVYLSIYLGIFVSVKWQAESFVDAWLDRIQTGQVNAAFLNTRRPDEAAGEDPANNLRLQIRYGKPSELPGFQQSDLVRVLRTQANPVIEKLGVHALAYEQNGFHVQLAYRISTSEGLYDWLITAQSSGSGQHRRWMISTRGSDTVPTDRPRLTPLGEKRQRLREQGKLFLRQVADRRTNHNVVGFYLDTLESRQRTAVESQMYTAAVGLAALQVGAGRLGGVPLLLLHHIGKDPRVLVPPAFAAFPKSTLVSTERLETQGDRRRVLLDAAPLFCQADSDVRLQINPYSSARFIPVPGNPDALRCELTMDAALFDRVEELAPRANAEIAFVAEGNMAGGRMHWRLIRVDMLREKVVAAREGAPPPR